MGSLVDPSRCCCDSCNGRQTHHSRSRQHNHAGATTACPYTARLPPAATTHTDCRLPLIACLRACRAAAPPTATCRQRGNLPCGINCAGGMITGLKADDRYLLVAAACSCCQASANVYQASSLGGNGIDNRVKKRYQRKGSSINRRINEYSIRRRKHTIVT